MGTVEHAWPYMDCTLSSAHSVSGKFSLSIRGSWMQACASLDAQQRPSARNLLAALTQLLAAFIDVPDEAN
jgi:hypothetical protein